MNHDDYDSQPREIKKKRRLKMRDVKKFIPPFKEVDIVDWVCTFLRRTLITVLRKTAALTVVQQTLTDTLRMKGKS